MIILSYLLSRILRMLILGRVDLIITITLINLLLQTVLEHGLPLWAFISVRVQFVLPRQGPVASPDHFLFSNDGRIFFSGFHLFLF